MAPQEELLTKSTTSCTDSQSQLSLMTSLWSSDISARNPPKNNLNIILIGSLMSHWSAIGSRPLLFFYPPLSGGTTATSSLSSSVTSWSPMGTYCWRTAKTTWPCRATSLKTHRCWQVSRVHTLCSFSAVCTSDVSVATAPTGPRCWLVLARLQAPPPSVPSAGHS